MSFVLPAAPRKPTFGERISQGLEKGIAGLQEVAAERKKEQMIDNENKVAAQYGWDLKGISDPKTRQEAFKEIFKQKAEDDFFNQNFGDQIGASPNQGQTAQKLQGMQEVDQNIKDQESPEIQKNAEKYTPEEKRILRLANKKPQLAHELNAIEERKTKEKRETRKEEIEFHKETQKYDEELIHQAKVAKKQIESIKDVTKAVKSGNIQPFSASNILRAFGKLGKKIADAITNADEATLKTSIPQLLEGWKDVFGIRLSDADLAILEDKLPSLGNSQEANEAVLKIMKKYADMTLLRSKIASEIKEKNNGLRPLGYADKIEKRFDEMIQPVKIINPKNGKIIEIPAYKVSDAIKKGARLATEESEEDENE